MLLKQLELHNFRQYIDNQVIEFSTDPEKNVTLILGKNTSGKTTLIQAFRWILYNNLKFTDRETSPNNVLNEEVRKKMRAGDTETASAKLTFVHNDITYEVERIYGFKSKISGDAKFDYNTLNMRYSDENDNMMPLRQNAHTKIEEILPESLAEYFFFDGEKISKSREKNNVRQSINTIMGLVPIEKMIEHIKGGQFDRDTSDNVLKKLNSFLKSTSESQSLSFNISHKENELHKAEKDRDDAHRLYEVQDDALLKIQEEFVRIQSIATFATKRKEVETKITNKNRDLKFIEQKTMEAFTPMLSELMVNFLSSKILENLKEFDYDDKGVPDMTAASVDFIINRGKCICGQCLESNPDCLKELKELRTYLPPESIGTQIRHFINDLQHFSSTSDKKEVYNSQHDVYYTTLDIINDLDNEYEDLSKKIGEDKDADVIKAKYEKIKNRRDELQRDEVRYQSHIEPIQKEIDSLKSRLKDLASNDEYNVTILNKIEYAEALLTRAINQYSSSSAEILEKMRKTISEVFSKMYHGNRSINLSDNYHVTLSVEGGSTLDNSTGLDTVQNFAFISSLLKVAKERVSMEINSEPYPLAMDAVFSNTDEIHIQRICSELPNLAEQAVLAIMEKDWNVARRTLDEHVGKKYEIVKETESRSRIKVI